MTNAFKGGRGITAPYQTTHCRVPIPLKEVIDKLVNEYKQLVVEEISTADLIGRLEEAIVSTAKPVNSLLEIQAIEILTLALSLKPQAGGAIKTEIRKAIKLLNG